MFRDTWLVSIIFSNWKKYSQQTSTYSFFIYIENAWNQFTYYRFDDLCWMREKCLTIFDLENVKTVKICFYDGHGRYVLSTNIWKESTIQNTNSVKIDKSFVEWKVE